MDKMTNRGGLLNQRSKGFTLVELLAVIVIVGILATVGVIAVTNIINNSENKALVEEGLNLVAAGRYAYENNDSLSGSDKVCISLQTLNETGYYEKGKAEDYSGSVLITNNDGKITTTFWINKENSKYIEGANLKATEDNVIKETKLKYENKESLNNGSFCGFKSDAEKAGVNVGTKDNLDEYDGKTPISITINDDSNIDINVQDITCKTDSGSGSCPGVSKGSAAETLLKKCLDKNNNDINNIDIYNDYYCYYQGFYDINNYVKIGNEMFRIISVTPVSKKVGIDADREYRIKLITEYYLEDYRTAPQASAVPTDKISLNDSQFGDLGDNVIRYVVKPTWCGFSTMDKSGNTPAGRGPTIANGCNGTYVAPNAYYKDWASNPIVVYTTDTLNEVLYTGTTVKNETVTYNRESMVSGCYGNFSSVKDSNVLAALNNEQSGYLAKHNNVAQFIEPALWYNGSFTSTSEPAILKSRGGSPLFSSLGDKSTLLKLFELERSLEVPTCQHFFKGTNSCTATAGNCRSPEFDYIQGDATPIINKIGLMYLSDWYSTYSDEKNDGERWLQLGFQEMTMTRGYKKFYLTSTAQGLKCDGNSCVTSDSIGSATGNVAAIRPVFYLKSSVKFTGGDGTKSNPYTLGL